MFAPLVYILCFLTSTTCAWLLLASYRRQYEPLLLWSALCFCLLAANNVLMFISLIVLPSIDMLPLREVTELAGIAVLLYGFVWESE